MGSSTGVLGQVTKGVGALAAGNAKDDALNFEAQQIRSSGKRVMAAAVAQAQGEERKAELLVSRATALAAASGASASDPTSVKIISDIKGEGAYRASDAIYQGKSQKALLQAQANAKQLQGKQARQASIVSAVGEYAKGGSDVQSLYDKYKSPIDLGDTSYEAFSGGSSSAAEWE